MKYVWLVVLLILMRWTWAMSNTSRSFSLEDHKQMEAELEKVIVDYIKAHRPGATEIYFQQLYTEVIKPGEQIRAHFRYQFEDPATGGEVTEQTFQGTVDFKYSPEQKNWIWAGEQVQSPMLRFRHGIKITPDGAEDMAEPETEAPAAPAASTGATAPATAPTAPTAPANEGAGHN